MLPANGASLLVVHMLCDARHTKMMSARGDRVIARSERVKTNGTRVAFKGQFVNVAFCHVG